VETNSASRNSMAPGSGGNKPDGTPYTPQELLIKAWYQHLDSIANSYPNLLSFTGAPGAQGNALRDKYGNIENLNPLISAAENDIAFYGRLCDKSLDTLEETFSKMNGMVNTGASTIKLDKLKIAAARWEGEKAQFIPSFYANPPAIIDFIKKRSYFKGITGNQEFGTVQKEMIDVEKNLEEVELSMKIMEGLGDTGQMDNYQNLSNLKSHLEHRYETFKAKYRTDLGLGGGGTPMDTSAGDVDWANIGSLAEARKEGGGEQIEYTGSSEKSEMEQYRNAFGIQFVLGDNGKIQQVITDGRTASPFTDTMGAHSIAWTLHISHVRSLIINKSVGRAYVAIATEFKDFVYGLEQDLDPSRSKGSIATRNARKELEKEINRIVRGDNRSVGTLQELIANLLAFTNFIPGITKKKNNTDGHGEAEAKRKLEEFEEEMWNRVPVTTSTLKESDMVDRIKTRYTNDNNLKDKAVYLANAVKVLRDTTGKNYIDIQYQMVENTYPWSYFTIQMGKYKFSSENDLKHVPPDPYADTLFTNKRPADGNPT